jgi:hypothetical protein
MIVVPYESLAKILVMGSVIDTRNDVYSAYKKKPCA